MGGIGLN